MAEQQQCINPKNNGGRDDKVETSRAEKPVYLLKCPSLVASTFKSHQQHNNNKSNDSSVAAAAKVIVSIDPLNCSDDSSPQFTMELAGSESSTAPKCYSLNMFNDINPMSAFSLTKNGKVSVEGTVVKKFDMKPHNGSFKEYGKLCRERTNKYMVKSRQLQVIDNDRNMRPMPGMVHILTSTSKDKKKATPVKGSETKRTRRDRGEMEVILFKLMERQSNWTLRQLVQETDQPEQFLKDMLKDLCVYNNKGTNQGTYELKPEYKKSNEETNA
ncbi:DNA helicase [Ranunculus cassubicifolius]